MLSVFSCEHSGYRKREIQWMVEDHLKSLVLKHFDPQKADLIFTEEGSVLSSLSFSYSLQHHFLFFTSSSTILPSLPVFPPSVFPPFPVSLLPSAFPLSSSLPPSLLRPLPGLRKWSSMQHGVTFSTS